MKHSVLTNKYGIDYLESIRGEFLGVEMSESNRRRKEQTVFLRWSDGNVGAVIVPTEDNIGNGCCCVFGRLEYVSIVIACERAGIKIQWKASNGYPLWPVWYTTPEKFAEFKQHYDSLIEKYS